MVNVTREPGQRDIVLRGLFELTRTFLDNADLCFEWRGPIDEAVVHLDRCGVAIEAGPIERGGRRGAGTSVYFRDPDGSLLELLSYA